MATTTNIPPSYLPPVSISPSARASLSNANTSTPTGNTDTAAAARETTGATLLAQIARLAGPNQLAEARLLRTGETIQLTNGSGLQPGQLVSVAPSPGTTTPSLFQVERGNNAVAQYLMRLLMPKDYASKQPVALLQRLQAGSAQPGTPAQSALTNLLLAGQPPRTATGTPATGALGSPAAGLSTAGVTAAGVPVTAVPATGTPAAGMPAAGIDPNLAATANNPASANTPITGNVRTLLNTLIHGLPERTSLDATMIREFIRMASLLQPRADGAAAATASQAGANSANNTPPGLTPLLLQLARLLAPSPTAESAARAANPDLRSTVADALGKLLLQQLQPMMNRADDVDGDGRRVDLLVRNEQQIDNFTLQFSRTPPVPNTTDDSDQKDTAEEERTQARCWNVRLTFNLEHLGQVSTLISYTEQRALTMNFWSESLATHHMIQQHRDLLASRLEKALAADNPIDINVDAWHGILPTTHTSLSSHLVDVKA